MKRNLTNFTFIYICFVLIIYQQIVIIQYIQPYSCQSVSYIYNHVAALLVSSTEAKNSYLFQFYSLIRAKYFSSKKTNAFRALISMAPKKIWAFSLHLLLRQYLVDYHSYFQAIVYKFIEMPLSYQTSQAERLSPQ